MDYIKHLDIPEPFHSSNNIYLIHKGRIICQRLTFHDSSITFWIELDSDHDFLLNSYRNHIPINIRLTDFIRHRSADVSVYVQSIKPIDSIATAYLEIRFQVKQKIISENADFHA